MKKSTPSRTITSLFLIFGLGLSAVYAAVNYNELFPNGTSGTQSQGAGWASPISSSKEIIIWDGTCKKITTTTSTQYYIPTYSQSAWTGFLANTPSGITIGYCPPIATLTASPLSVTYGSGTQLTWTSVNTDYCERTGVNPVPYGTWPSGHIATGGTIYTNPLINSPTTFYLQCHGLDGTYATANVSVRINPINCVGSWSEVSPNECSRICGGGKKKRIYTISTPAQFLGNACPATNGAIDWNGSNCNTFSCTQTASCGGSIATNATRNSTSTSGTFTQTWNGSTYAPTSMNWSYGTSSCGYNCNTNYTWNGSTCVANTQTYSCPTKPTGSSWNSVASYTQTWNGSSWSPASTSTTYNTTSSTTSCRFTCNTGYHEYGGTCVANPACSTSSYDTCTSGSASNSNYATACDTSRTWKCSNGSQTVNCSIYNGSCTVDCVGSWSDVSPEICSKPCGSGVKQQEFNITTYASNGGASCGYSDGSTRWGSTSCNTQACPTSGPYTLGSWGSCTGPCGTNNGTQSRTVSCGYTTCTGQSNSSQSCTASTCSCTGTTPCGTYPSCRALDCNSTCGTATDYNGASAGCGSAAATFYWKQTGGTGYCDLDFNCDATANADCSASEESDTCRGSKKGASTSRYCYELVCSRR